MKFFRIPVRDPAASEEDLNGFLGSHRITTVERRFVDEGENSFWALCVEWSPAGGAKEGARERSGSIDYREVLPTEQFEKRGPKGRNIPARAIGPGSRVGV